MVVLKRNVTYSARVIAQGELLEWYFQDCDIMVTKAAKKLMAAQKLGVSSRSRSAGRWIFFFVYYWKNIRQSFTVFFQGPKFFNSGITNSPSVASSKETSGKKNSLFEYFSLYQLLSAKYVLLVSEET